MCGCLESGQAGQPVHLIQTKMEGQSGKNQAKAGSSGVNPRKESKEKKDLKRHLKTKAEKVS